MTRVGRRRPSTEREIGLGVLALLLVAALVSTVVTVLPEDASRVLAAGEMVPLESQLYSGEAHEVLVPGTSLTLRVGEPVEEVAHAVVDLGEDADWSDTDPVRPADGAGLVPVAWSALPTADIPRQAPDTTEVSVTMVAGDERIDIVTGTVEELRQPDEERDPRSRIIALEDDLAEDLTVEVEYDGVTQVLDVAAGTVDTGAAEGLYSPATTIGTGCAKVSDWCHLSPDPDALWQPEAREANFVAGDISTRAYDEELGWAGEDRLWASLYLQDFTTYGVVDASGERREVADKDPLEVTLDGERPEHSSLDTAEDTSGGGHATFAIDADEQPQELDLRTTLSLEGSERPQRVPLRTTIRLGDE